MKYICENSFAIFQLLAWVIATQILSVLKRIVLIRNLQDTPAGRLSAMGAKSFRIGPLHHYPGRTPELVKQIMEEMEDPMINKTLGYEFHFVWARRKL